MRPVLIVSLILFLSGLVSMSQPSAHPVKDIIQLLVMGLELIIKSRETIVLVNDKYNVSVDIGKPEVLEGLVGAHQISITGLNNLEINQNNIDFNLTDSIFSFCANLSIPKTTSLEIIKYDVDIEIASTINLYGKGNLIMGAKDIDFALCAKVDLTEPLHPQLTDFLLKPNISGLEFELTGFLNNPELSKVITDVIASLEGIVMLFWDEEIRYITCILSKSLGQMINDLLNRNTTITNFSQIAEIRKDCEEEWVPSNNIFAYFSDLIPLLVMGLELIIKSRETIVFVNDKYNVPVDIGKPEVLEGVVGAQQISITGLNNLEINRNNIDFNLTDSIFSFCANLSIPKTTSLEIINYDVDIAIASTIPLYGKGNLIMGVKDIDFALCAKIDQTEPLHPQLTDFLLKPNISGLEFELTGFWNNPELSEVITDVIAGVEGIVMSFWVEEIKCITCILSMSLGQMINDLLNRNTTIMNFSQIAEITKDCEGECVPSNNIFWEAIFNINLSDLLGSLLRDDNVNKFVYSVEEYFNQYLEEHFYE